MVRQIEALLVERLGYERRGLTDRVAAVDERLKQLGYKTDSVAVETAAVEPSAERSVKRKSKKREV